MKVSHGRRFSRHGRKHRKLSAVNRAARLQILQSATSEQASTSSSSPINDSSASSQSYDTSYLVQYCYRNWSRWANEGRAELARMHSQPMSHEQYWAHETGDSESNVSKLVKKLTAVSMSSLHRLDTYSSLATQ